jgi:hypothetical protein
MLELSNYTMEVSWEQVDTIIKKELRSTLQNFEEELNKIEDCSDRVGVFCHDAIEDYGKILAHKRACELLLEYWGEKL